MYAICPRDPAHDRFLTTIQVTEEWLVDQTGTPLERRGLVDSETPDPENNWHCVDCGAIALTGEGERMFNPRQTRLITYMNEYGQPEVEEYIDLAAPGRYLLIERNLKSEPPYWLSTHASPQIAADYHVGQEYSQDWAVDALIDLDTGEPIEATVETRFG